MSPIAIHPFRPTRFGLTVLFLAASGLVLAQSQPPASPQPPSGGWRRLGDPPPPPNTSSQPPVTQSQDPAEPVDRSDAYGQPAQGRQNPPADPQAGQPPAPSRDRPSYRPPYGLPAEVTLKPGTFVTMRINQPLSSDHNQPGDTFSGTLIQPVVVDGIVVAQRGEAVYGRVAESQKAHGGNSSRLGLELTSLTLADGTQVPVRTQLVARQGSTTPAGAQVGTVATTTAVGAVVGGAADYGRGAAIGAGAGAAAGIIGVLLTRNHPTVVYPETALTFRIEAPVTINTAHAPQAFRYVGPEEYNRPPRGDTDAAATGGSSTRILLRPRIRSFSLLPLLLWPVRSGRLGPGLLLWLRPWIWPPVVRSMDEDSAGL
jgi:hypothetical protein